MLIMSGHRAPTYLEIRERISRIGTEFEVSDIPQIPKDHTSEQYRMAFMYQLLIAGRISEVCGRYAPKGIEVYEVEFDTVPAAMFVVKTAKRDGKLRAAALPLDPKYEPWTKSLLEYFQEAGDDYPFMFADKFQHSIRYAQWVAAKTFEGLEWPMKHYAKAELQPITDFEILATRINDKNKEVCLIELDEDSAKWVPKVGDNLRVPVKIEARWKPFRSHALRKRRTVTLMYFNKFDGFARSAYGGWTEKSQVETLPEAMSHYTHLDLTEFAESFDMLYDMASLYFQKLLRPFSEQR